jgi:hypothetical protein
MCFPPSHYLRVHHWLAVIHLQASVILPDFCVGWSLVLRISVSFSSSHRNTLTTGYGLDDRGFGIHVPVGSRIFSFPRRPDRLWGPPNVLSNGNRGASPGGKAARAWMWPTWYPLDRSLGGPQSRSGRRGNEKILDPTGTWTATPRSCSPYPVSVPTALSWLVLGQRIVRKIYFRG